MPRLRLIIVMVLAVGMAPAGFSLGAEASTRPARPSVAEARVHAALEWVRRATSDLSLTGDQKKQIDNILSQANEQAGKLARDLADLEPRQRFRQVRDFLQEAIRDVAGVLMPDQREKLRERTRPRHEQAEVVAPRSRNGHGSATRPTAAADAPMDMMDSSESAKAHAHHAAVDDDSSAINKGPSVGDAAPALALPTLDGHRLTLSAKKGRIVLLVFGSYSSPSFRQRSAELEKLSRDYSIRAQIYVIYTREAHAAGEWEVNRNKDADIKVQQPETAQAREDLARTARTKLKLTVPIALDTIDNTARTAFGAGENSAYLIGRDGKVLARQQWFEAGAMRRMLDSAVASAKAAPVISAPSADSE